MMEKILIDRSLLELLVTALATQKFIYEFVPWKREEVQQAIDQTFNEGMKALAQSHKPEEKDSCLK